MVEANSEAPRLASGPNNPGLSLPEAHVSTIVGNGYSLDGQDKYQIINVQKATLTMWDIVIKNGGNPGTNHGGGGAISSQWSQFSCFRCQFLDNYDKSGWGGALYLYPSKTQLEDVLFKGNSAGNVNSGHGYGGAIYNDGGPFYCKNCQFIDNYATSYGAAINPNVRAVGGTPADFKARYGMDPVIANGLVHYPFELNNVHFSGNTATKNANGQAIWDGNHHLGRSDTVFAFGGPTTTITCPAASAPFSDVECWSDTNPRPGSGGSKGVNCASFTLDSSWVQAPVVPPFKGPTCSQLTGPVPVGLTCTKLIDVPGSQLANTAFWANHCSNIPAGAQMIRIDMGNVTDYFKPIVGKTYCEMLGSDTLHQYSPDGVDWMIPVYHGIHLGGSQNRDDPGWKTKYPGDQRLTVSFWGDNSLKGGCCHYECNDGASWGLAFSMYYCA